MSKTTMTPQPLRRRAGVLAALLSLAALLALAPAVEAASYRYGTYRTTWGTFPVIRQDWGYWLTRTPAQDQTPNQGTDPAPAPQPAPAPDETPASTSGYAPTAAERLAVDLLNADRAKNGLPALKLNPDLAKVAHVKAQDMAENGYFDHTSPTYGSPFEMMTKFGISYRAAGENIAKARSVENAEELFMDSSGHRANILSSTYNQVGVGVFVGADGATYVSQMFIKA